MSMILTWIQGLVSHNSPSSSFVVHLNSSFPNVSISELNLLCKCKPEPETEVIISILRILLLACVVGMLISLAKLIISVYRMRHMREEIMTFQIEQGIRVKKYLIRLMRVIHPFLVHMSLPLTAAELLVHDLCFICMERFLVGDLVPRLPHSCLQKHNFMHGPCLEKWFVSQQLTSPGTLECPICRKGIDE